MAYVLGDAPPPAPAHPIKITVGVPGLSAEIPLISQQRMALALGASAVFGLVASVVLNRYFKKRGK